MTDARAYRHLGHAVIARAMLDAAHSTSEMEIRSACAFLRGGYSAPLFFALAGHVTPTGERLERIDRLEHDGVARATRLRLAREAASAKHFADIIAARRERRRLARLSATATTATT